VAIPVVSGGVVPALKRSRPEGGAVEGPFSYGLSSGKEVLRLRFAPLRTTGKNPAGRPYSTVRIDHSLDRKSTTAISSIMAKAGSSIAV